MKSQVDEQCFSDVIDFFSFEALIFFPMRHFFPLWSQFYSDFHFTKKKGGESFSTVAVSLCEGFSVSTVENYINQSPTFHPKQIPY